MKEGISFKKTEKIKWGLLIFAVYLHRLPFRLVHRYIRQPDAGAASHVRIFQTDTIRLSIMKADPLTAVLQSVAACVSKTFRGQCCIKLINLFHGDAGAVVRDENI